MKVKILSKMWDFAFAKINQKEGGFCDPDTKKNKRIRIQKRFKGEHRLRLIIHEVLHASNFHTFSEEFVDELSSDLARILWRLGYREQE